MNDYLNDQLDKLLSESLISVKERERTAFDELIGNQSYDGYVLFGSGVLGKRTLAGLRKIGIEPHAFADNNTSLWNTSIDGIPVLSPKEAIEKYPNDIYILTIWSDVIGHPLDEIQKQLNEHKQITLFSFTFLYWKYPEVFLPYFEIDLPHKTIEQIDLIKAAYLLWNDDASRNEFLAQIRLRLRSDSNGLPAPANCKQYFPDDLFKINSDEVFIDCGAFDGDTFRNFSSKSGDIFKQYIAYEPDPNNYKNFLKGLEEHISTVPNNISDKVSAYQLAVSDCKKKISFEANGLQSVMKEDGSIVVDCISLDDEIDFIPTYIKMDVEGDEPNVIIGATNLIKKHSPILAISAYHQFDHLWKLPLLVKSLASNYKFYLRPHCKAGWDLVCYAIPNHRLKVHE